MLLAGDIGGTKTVLALYDLEKGVTGGAVRATRFESGKYDSLETIIAEFLQSTGVHPTTASFGVAGPVARQRAQITNLPWSISAETIGRVFGIDQVFLLNDLEAIALAVPHLTDEDIVTLNKREGEPQGNIVIVAPGTGLGVAFLVWTGQRYKACASEGGHSAFAPRNILEIELLEHLSIRYGHVSFERICSGSHLPNIYDFLMEKGGYDEPGWLREKLENTADRTPVIVRAALEHKTDVCEATLDMFVHMLGTMVSNMAITLLPTGGIYLGGGIPPRILERLRQPDFLRAISDKGRFFNLCARMPVHVITTSCTALHGAAWYGIDTMNR